VAALAVIAAAWSWWGRPGPETALGEKSIAVLPFVNFSGSEEDEYFSDGITDDILTHLSKIGNLKVIARTSIVQYKNTEKRIRDIGRELGVATILEGSVRRAGSRVRISGQLVDAETEEHLWAEIYDRDLTDVFAIQSDVASQIAAALKATLTPEEKSYLERKPTENLEAYDYYLKGNYYWLNYNTLEGHELAVRMYEKAIELDPEFALAYAKLSIMHSTLYSVLGWDHTPERLEKARIALEKARELSPDLPEIHYALAEYAQSFYDYDRALKEYELALEIQPNNSEIIWGAGYIFARHGKWDQAKKYLLRAHDLDPQSELICHHLSALYGFLRNWAEAERWANLTISIGPDEVYGYDQKAWVKIGGYGDLSKAREVIEEGEVNTNERFDYRKWMIELYSRNYSESLPTFLNGTSALAYYGKGYTYSLLGEEAKAAASYDSARVQYEELVQGAPDNALYHRMLGGVYAGLGRKEEAIRAGEKAVELAPVSKDAYIDGPDALIGLANTYILVGEYDQALDKLEYLLSIPSNLSIWRLKLSPIYEPLRELPRFQALLEK
jgi:TolB-like protein/Tfp pilus assembly protein PilF